MKILQKADHNMAYFEEEKGADGPIEGPTGPPTDMEE